MATSQCIKCGGSRFEMATAPITNANFNYAFVQCASCGCVVGVTEGTNLEHTIKQAVADVTKQIQLFQGEFGRWANVTSMVLGRIAKASGIKIVNPDGSDFTSD